MGDLISDYEFSASVITKQPAIWTLSPEYKITDLRHHNSDLAVSATSVITK